MPRLAPSRRRRRFVAWAIIVVVALAGLSMAVVGWGTGRMQRPYKGFSGDEVFVDVAPGTGVAGIARQLAEAGVVPDALTFRIAVRVKRAERRLKAGEYRFSTAASPFAVVDRLTRGEVFLRPITFPEGLTIAEMARLFEARGFGDAAAFEEAARQADLVEDLDPAAPDLEGYLFPETYALPRRADAKALVRQMVGRFRTVFGEEQIDRAKAQGRSVREVVTLASVVEKETAVAEERPIVAGVYANRLRIGMGLQADPTVIYALARAGRWDGNLTRENLRFDSPYNTYRYAGLPPGPIAAPGRAALEAALEPADVPYLYFVSQNDGSHVFAETLAEHNRNVREWQVQFHRNRR